VIVCVGVCMCARGGRDLRSMLRCVLKWNGALCQPKLGLCSSTSPRSAPHQHAFHTNKYTRHTRPPPRIGCVCGVGRGVERGGRSVTDALHFAAVLATQSLHCWRRCFDSAAVCGPTSRSAGRRRS